MTCILYKCMTCTIDIGHMGRSFESKWAKRRQQKYKRRYPEWREKGCEFIELCSTFWPCRSLLCGDCSWFRCEYDPGSNGNLGSSTPAKSEWLFGYGFRTNEDRIRRYSSTSQWRIPEKVLMKVKNIKQTMKLLTEEKTSRWNRSLLYRSTYRNIAFGTSRSAQIL